jgi:hypothetical protein
MRTHQWTFQQLREAIPADHAYGSLIGCLPRWWSIRRHRNL